MKLEHSARKEGPRMYKPILIAIFALIPRYAFSDVIVCDMGDYIKRNYEYQFLYLDLENKQIKLGNQQKWSNPVKFRERLIPIGQKIEWSYLVYSAYHKKDINIEMALRINTSNEIDLLDVRALNKRFKIKSDLNCKRA